MKTTHKKAFTLIEILLVVIVLGIIVSASRNFFNSSRQEKILFWENCSNYIHGVLSTLVSDIQYGKTTSWSLDDANHYEIRYSIGKIEVWYIQSGSDAFILKETIKLGKNIATGNWKWCTNNQFSLATTWTATMNAVAIPAKNGGLSTLWDGNRFIGSDITSFTNTLNTWSIDLYVCDKNIENINDTSCVNVSRVLIDRRSKQISLYKCLTRDSKTGKCTSRPTWF